MNYSLNLVSPDHPQNFHPFLFSILFSIQKQPSCCCSVSKLCATLCNPMDCSMPSFPVLHYHLEFAQIHVQWVSDATEPSHPLSSSSLALNLCQHQGLFQWVSFLHQVAKYWSFNISPSNEYLGLISFRINWLDLLASPRDSQESSPTPQFKSINSSLLSLYGPILTSIHDYWENHTFDCMDFSRQSLCFLICWLG